MGSMAGGELHAVLVPFPAQGHINPFLHLARQLVRVHGFRVTFINVAQNLHDRCVRYSSSATTRWDAGIKFVVLPDAPGEFSMSTGAQMQKFMSALTNLGPNFSSQLQELLAESSITCMIRDWVMPSAHKAARKLGIPVAALATMSAAATHCFFHQEAFESHCSLIPGPAAACDNEAQTTAESAAEEEEEEVSWMDRIKTFPPPPKDSAEAAMLKRTVGDVLPGLAPDLTVADLPSHFWIRRPRPRSEAESTKYSEQNELLRDCDCLLVNTFDELEGAAIRGMDQNSLILPVGPLVFNPRADDSHSRAENGNGPARLQQEPDLGDAITCSLREEDPTTMQWLDKQDPASVIYVSFGSLASVAGEQLVEIAQGLEASHQPFLWVMREDLVFGEESSEYFCNFMRSFREATKDRSHIAPWVAQTAVLAHPAVGAFLSHCGWNSTLESVAAGVPMVAMPVFADQLVNGFYATQVWGNGVRMEREVAGLQVTRDEVARKVRTVLLQSGQNGAGAGAALRARAAELRKAARAAVLPGGSSHSAMAKFVHHMINARIPKLLHDPVVTLAL